MQDELLSVPAVRATPVPQLCAPMLQYVAVQDLCLC
ncbi:hypothetical protein EVA_11651 [gut metagenome]|uniref:Uncharacterized protein n=1 Tax=gut metagenome TaxID=749906 RepID=J9FZ38_9ZZZZ